MSQEYRIGEIGPGPAAWVGPSEPESHTEHQAALDATVFHVAAESDELVFELDAGQLRVRPPRLP